MKDVKVAVTPRHICTALPGRRFYTVTSLALMDVFPSAECVAARVTVARGKGLRGAAEVYFRQPRSVSPPVLVKFPPDLAELQQRHEAGQPVQPGEFTVRVPDSVVTS